tara:strand:+ start:209 stop:811 length:603 start_codon:yes stop_codon:yes gene_type:complete
MEIFAENNQKAFFTTTKAGRKDKKSEGGTVRGRHTVAVELYVGSDHKTIAGLDLIRLESIDRDVLRDKIESTGLTFTQQEFDLALDGDQPRKKGLITSLRESSTGTNTDNKHLNAYSNHPCGVRGVVIHDDTGNIHIKGIIVSEKVLIEDPNGNARKVKSGTHVQLKNAISKELDLTTRKWRQYRLPPNTIVNGLGTNTK